MKRIIIFVLLLIGNLYVIGQKDWIKSKIALEIDSLFLTINLPSQPSCIYNDIGRLCEVYLQNGVFYKNDTIFDSIRVKILLLNDSIINQYPRNIKIGEVDYDLIQYFNSLEFNTEGYINNVDTIYGQYNSKINYIDLIYTIYRYKNYKFIDNYKYSYTYQRYYYVNDNSFAITIEGFKSREDKRISKILDSVIISK